MTNKVFIVLKHEFIQKVRAKSFIILTLLGPVLLVLIFGLPILFGSINSGGTRTIAVIDHSGKIYPAMVAIQDSSSGKSSDKKLHFQHVMVGTNEQQLTDSLRRLVIDKSLSGYLVIPAAALDTEAKPVSSSLHLSNPNDMEIVQTIRQAYESAVTNEKLHALGYDPKVYENVKNSASIEAYKVEGQSETKASAGSYVAGYVTGFLLYMAMLLYGLTIMRSVIEEKSSRIMEIVASSVDPMDLLVGKVLGVGLAGLVQMSVWALILALTASVGLSSLSAMAGGGLEMQFSPFIFIYFVMYFIFGYLLYATLYAAIGATAEQESDVQQISMPITFLIIIPFITLSTVIQSPSSTTSVILSLVPFFSPILMMGRIFSETPPAWQIALSFVLMALTFLGVLWVGARIYRVGILMYGKKFSLPEILRWLKYS
jgi:ABC-2 type transport system permease protein